MDDPSISFGVMAHAARDERARALSALLEDAPITWADANAPGDVWGTARRAWASAPPGTGWHVVLQDDAVPAHDFLAAARRVLAVAPADPCAVSFFSFADTTLVGAPRDIPFGGNRVQVRTAVARQRTYWLELTGETLYAVALALPRWVILPMLAWIDANEEALAKRKGWGVAPGTRHDDARILAWTKAASVPCFVAVPNIVDHLDGASLANPKTRSVRKSKNFLSQGAAELDWTPRPGGQIRVRR